MTLDKTLARVRQAAGGELARLTPIETYRPLDRYAGGLADIDQLPQVPWLATISAGYRAQDGLPKASRRVDDAWIHMTPEDLERAPGLAEALEERAWRSVDVALPFDDPNQFLQQHFERRSATRLEVFGDERQLTQITVRRQSQGNNKTVDVGERKVFPAGSPEYADLVRTCNVSCSFFFVLARWDGRQPRIYFPASDGLGVYRLRFTSRHSLRELLASLRQISALAGGRVSGIPLRLGVDWRAVADPSGATREIPVWTLRFMPPQGLELTPALWLDLKREAIAEGELLRALPAPTLETIDDAEQAFDADLDDATPAALERLQAGPRCDAKFYEAAFFARVRGTPLDDGAARAAFLEGYPGSNTNSLAIFLEEATEAQASALIAAVGTYLASIDQARDRELQAQRARRYDEIFGGDEDTPRPEPPTPAAAPPPQEPRPTPQPAAEQPPAPPPADPLLKRNRELVARAKQLGLEGLSPLADTSEGLAGINADLEARIEYAEGQEIDRAEAERQRREEGLK